MPLKDFAAAVILSLVIDILGRVVGTVVDAPWGIAGSRFFEFLAAGVFSSALADLMWPKVKSDQLIAGRRRLWLAIATGAGIISYLEADAGFSTVDIVVSVILGAGLVAMTAAWVRLARRDLGFYRGGTR